jgi:hypothetical protein
MKSRAATNFVSFDIVYKDGSRSSNRKVLASLLGGLDGDEPARGVIEGQDREVAAASGRQVREVDTIVRSPVKVASEQVGSERKGKSGRG